MNKILLQSNRQDWETPDSIYIPLDEEFHFKTDVASSDRNHKAPIYYTKETDGLSQEWNTGTVWCNPPYGRQIGKWVKKAYEQNMKYGTTVVMLIPSRTDTKWFHDYIYGAAEIRFIRGRVRFTLDGKEYGCSTFPSMIVVFR